MEKTQDLHIIFIFEVPAGIKGLPELMDIVLEFGTKDLPDHRTHMKISLSFTLTGALCDGRRCAVGRCLWEIRITSL